MSCVGGLGLGRDVDCLNNSSTMVHVIRLLFSLNHRAMHHHICTLQSLSRKRSTQEDSTDDSDSDSENSPGYNKPAWEEHGSKSQKIQIGVRNIKVEAENKKSTKPVKNVLTVHEETKVRRCIALTGRNETQAEKENEQYPRSSEDLSKAPIGMRANDHTLSSSNSSQRDRAPLQSTFNSKSADSCARTPSISVKVNVFDPFEKTHRAETQHKVLPTVLNFDAQREGPSSWKVFDFRNEPSPFKITKKKLAAAAAGAAQKSMSLVPIRAAEGKPLESLGRLELDDGKKGGKCAGSFAILKFLGGGSYGSVFSIRPLSAPNVKSVAIKIEKGRQTLPWEVYVLHKLLLVHVGAGSSTISPQSKAQRAAELADLVISPRGLIIYNDACCLLLPQAAGTLLAILECHVKSNSSLSEISAAFFVSRMIRGLEVIVSAELIHSDLKLDNWLIFVDDCRVRVTIADFGRCLDRGQYPEGTRFRFNDRTLQSFGAATKELVCGAQWERSLEEGGSWTHELDFHAMGVAVLALVVPQHEEAVSGALLRYQYACQSAFDKEQIPKFLRGIKLPRSWNSECWSCFIEDMFNPAAGKHSLTFTTVPRITGILNLRFACSILNEALAGSTSGASFMRVLRTHRLELESLFEGHQSKLNAELKNLVRGFS